MKLIINVIRLIYQKFHLSLMGETLYWAVGKYS